ncbi:MAG: cytochrome P450 [Gammaproteobacteria bacterium]|nr:cytochrome P450 [Gammaproteobacteria bacterium]MDH5653517.1 cytochrome P450 [Gammaproteobacteria bacterium]
MTDKDYLQIFDAAEDNEKFPLVYGWMKTEPLPFFKQLRAESPVLVTPEVTLVTLFEDVRDLLQMPKIFTVELYKPKMGDYLMTHDEDALHDREKSIMYSMLNRDDVPLVRKLITRNAKTILDRAGGKIEIVENYCRGVPASLVQDYFGLDGVDPKKLIDWSFWNQYNAFHNHHFNLESRDKFDHIVAENERVKKELTGYIAKLVFRKSIAVKLRKLIHFLATPLRMLLGLIYLLFGKKDTRDRLTDTTVTRMLATSYPKEVDFPIARLGLNAGGLLIGAIETTSQAVAQSIEMILKDPNLLAQAKAAAEKEDTTEFDNIVWETLRYVPISPFVFRVASEAYVIAKGRPHETLVKAGTTVLVCTQSAMFDDYAYSNPDEFDPNRTFYHNFNFGFGYHECMGKHIGMVLIPEMVRQVILRKNIKADDAKIDYDDKPFPTFYNLSWDNA